MLLKLAVLSVASCCLDSSAAPFHATPVVCLFLMFLNFGTPNGSCIRKQLLQLLIDSRFVMVEAEVHLWLLIWDSTAS